MPERLTPRYLGPWRIDVTSRAGVQRISSIARLTRAMARALDAAGAPSPASIGLILADDSELADLNRIHMGETGPTDVLSFPLLDPMTFPDHPGRLRRSADRSVSAFRLPPGRRPHLGDVVLSVERAIAQAASGRGGQTSDVRWSAADELRLLAVHGTLHVCGWDHADPTERDAMRALEARLLG
jgi:probable rRNA maturation factor